MANYYGTGRSNRFKVKDRKAFDEWLDKYGNWFSTSDREEAGGCELVLIGESECGDVPSHGEDDEEINFMQEIAEHLVDEPGNYFIWMTAGHEKMRYITGFASAVNANGDEVWVGLDDIYRIVEKEFGHPPNHRAQY